MYHSFNIKEGWAKLQRMAHPPITSFYRLPKKFQVQIKEMLKLYDIEELYLHGSYFNGLWHDEGTGKEFTHLKKLCYQAFGKPWKAYSDLDLLSPEVKVKFKYKDLDIMSGVGKVKILEKGKLI